MPYPNVPRLFTTDPGGANLTSADTAGMSRYYVYADGVVRVKFQDGFVHANYGKNICYARAADIARDRRDPLYFWVDGSAIKYSEAMNRNKGMQYAEVGKNTIDFFLEGDRYRANGKFHHGHAITAAAFAATIKGKAVKVAKLDSAIAAMFGPTTGAMRRIAGVPMAGQDSKLVPIAELGDIT
ncbi:MAG TPA: hypothetical protein VGF56_05640 [Rhizomicrobium sp.]|jgi:hypothetical protein